MKHDQARARNLVNRANAKIDGLSPDAVVSVPAENQAVSYVVNVGVGSPATTCTLPVVSLVIHSKQLSYDCFHFRQPHRGHWKLQHLGWRGKGIRQNEHQHSDH